MTDKYGRFLVQLNDDLIALGNRRYLGALREQLNTREAPATDSLPSRASGEPDSPESNRRKIERPALRLVSGGEDDG